MCLSTLIGRGDLTADQTGWVMRQILAGEATPSQIAGFAVALRAKGETVEEVEGLVATMYEFAAPFEYDGRAVDIVGTGGDRSHTVNISTMAAIVAAGAGAAGAQARQPLGVVEVRVGRRARGARDPARSDAGAGRGRDGARSGSPSASRRSSTARCGTPPCRGASSASRRRSTSSARSPTRPAPPPRRSVSPTPGWRGSSPACSPVAASRDSCSAATTASTSSPRRRPRTSGRSSVARSARESSTRPTSASARSQPDDLRGGDVDVQRRRRAPRRSQGERGPVRDAVLLNAASAIAAYDAATDPSPSGWRWPRARPRPSTPVPPSQARRLGRAPHR